MECSICLCEEGSFINLHCGHRFHQDCIKKWYMKGDAGKNCPICRKIIYGKFVRKWKTQRLEQRKNDLWFEYFDDIIDTYKNFSTYHEFKLLANCLMNELIDLELIFNTLTPEELTLEDDNTPFFGYCYEYPNYDVLMFVGDHPHDIIADKNSYTTLNNRSLNMFST